MNPNETLTQSIKESGCSNMRSWYREFYLKSEHWINLRSSKLESTGRLCEKCGSKKQVQVHHLNYKKIFDVELTDLQVLCGPCHRTEHGNPSFKGASTIFKSNPSKHFTKIPNAILRAKMSPHAKAIIVYMLSHTDGWIANMETLKADLGFSRAATSKGVRELERMGYAKSRYVKKDGRFVGVLWKWSDTSMNQPGHSQQDHGNGK